MGTLARVVRLIVSIIVLILVAGIVLVLLKANPTSTIVSDIHDAAHWLAGPFNGLPTTPNCGQFKAAHGAGKRIAPAAIRQVSAC